MAAAMCDSSERNNGPAPESKNQILVRISRGKNDRLGALLIRTCNPRFFAHIYICFLLFFVVFLQQKGNERTKKAEIAKHYRRENTCVQIPLLF